MSTSELFALRNRLLKNSFAEFKKALLAQKTPLDLSLLTNLFLLVYENESFRRSLFQYLSFFAQYSLSIVHTQIGDRRRLLEDLSFCGRAEDVKQLSAIIINSQAGLENYELGKLIKFALEGRSSSDSIVATIGELLSIRRYLANSGQFMVVSECNMLVLYALKKDLFVPAFELLKNNIGLLGKECEELFALTDCKISKRETDILCKFIEMYLDKSKCNPRHTDRKGRAFIQYLPKEHQNTVEQVLKEFERGIEKIEKHIRRSENKVRSSLGPGENVKQYSNQPLNVSSKEKFTYNIHNMDDELSIQRQAGRLYQKHIIEIQKHYRYQKNQKKQAQLPPRVGIMTSDELRHYLEEDIDYEVNKLKEENKRCKPYYIEIINKLKERLCGPLMIDLQVFGSVETALCLPQSDIDIIILPNKPNQEIYPFQLLENIQQLLEDMSEQILSVKLIKSATVPIIKVICTEKYLGKRIDITYRDDNHNGREAVRLVCSYKQEYPQLQSLIFVLKKFIYASNLSQPYLGGLSSYGLILMIVAYIQQQYKIHQVQKKQEPLMVADLLIGFLKFYGFKMNYIMKSIEICDRSEAEWQKYTGCLSRYTDPTNPIIDLQPKLVIIDPLNKDNNIGRSTHKIKHIQMAFEIAFISIHTFKQCGKKRRCESFRRIGKCPVDVRYADQQRPCCILKRMFACTQKFIKE